MEIDQQTARYIWEAANQFAERMDKTKSYGDQIAAKTVRIIRLALVTFGVVALINLAILAFFTDRMQSVVTNMVDMYTRFGDMSKDMAIITHSVTNMEANIRGIPEITTSMSTLTGNVGLMQKDVGSMTSNILEMDQNMTVISGGVNQMADRFGHLTSTVHGMRYNVNQMSQPIRSSSPWFMPFQ